MFTGSDRYTGIMNPQTPIPHFMIQGEKGNSLNVRIRMRVTDPKYPRMRQVT